MKKWYLLKTKPQKEKIAVENLKNQNYHVYCPMATINREKVALFPGYLFVFLDETSENWSPIRSTKGVSNFVKFGLNFAKIPDKVVELIEANERVTAKKVINLNNFKPGETVQITDGVFENCLAIFKTFKSDDRVILLMNLMGQQQSINIRKQSVIGL